MFAKFRLLRHPGMFWRLTNLPGTARCLSGMALSLEGSEPIQSALTLPIPAGLVFMSRAANNRVRTPLSGTDARPVADSRAIPTRNNQNKSSWKLTVNFDAFAAPRVAHLRRTTAQLPGKTGHPWRDQRGPNELSNPLMSYWISTCNTRLSPPTIPPLDLSCSACLLAPCSWWTHTNPKHAEKWQIRQVFLVWIIVRSQQILTRSLAGWLRMKH